MDPLQHSFTERQKRAGLFACISIPIFLLYVYHNPVRWDALFYYLFPANAVKLLCAGVIGFAGYGAGYGISRRLAPGFSSVPVWVMSIGVGWGVIGYWVFGLALAQCLNVYLLAPVVLLLAVWGWKQSGMGVDLCKAHCRAWVTAWDSAGRTVRVIGCMVGLTVFYAVVSSLMPPTQSDGLRYHLTVPKLYLDAGGFFLIEDLAFSNFPFLIEYLYAIPLAIGQISVPKLLHCSYFLLTLVVIFHASKRIANESGAWIAVLIFASTPFVPIFASWSFIEFGLTFYTLLSFVLVCDWCEAEKQPDARGSRRLLLLIGITAGLAVSCKYTALASAMAVAGFVGASVFLERKRFFQAIGYAGFLFGVALSVASPWFIKNWILLGNPVYPFARSVFPTPNWSEFNALFFAYHAGIKGGMNVFEQSSLTWKLWDLISLPFFATFYPGEPHHYPHNFGSWPLGAVWLAVVPLLLLYRPGKARYRDHLLFALFLYFLWAFTYRDTRFLLPCLAVLAPVCGLVLWETVQPRRWVKVLLGVVIFYNFLFTTGLMLIPESYAPWWVVSGLIPEEQYLMNDSRDTRYRNRAFRYLSEQADPDETVLLHGIDHGFYCPNPYIGADWFNTDPLIRLTWEVSSVEELLERLREKGVKYIVYDYGNIQRYNQDFQPYYRLFCLPTEQSVPLLKEWVKNESSRFHYPGVYRIWFERFIPRLNGAFRSAPNVEILRSVLDGERLKEVYRFDRDETDPYEGIKILKVE